MGESSARDRLAAVTPYLEPLLYDREVQGAVRRAAEAGRRTYLRARGKPPAEALKDKRLRRRARSTAIAAWQVWAAVDAAHSRRRPRWRRRLLLVPVAVAGAYGVYLASNADGREALRRMIPDRDRPSRA